MATPQIRSESLVKRLYYAYFLGPEHPAKWRICGYIRKIIRDRRVVIPYNGSGWISVVDEEMVQRHVLLFGAYEPEVFDSLMAYATANEVVWDAGAHVGSFTIKAAMDPRVAKTYAFEPMPATREILLLNLDLNGLLAGNRVTVFDCALSDRNGTLAMQPPTEGNTGTASIQKQAAGTLPVQATTVDQIISSGKASPPTLMKIDVEDAEEMLFLGAAETLRRHPPKAIAFECACDAAGTITNRNITRLLAAAGYTVSHIVRPGGARIEPRENYIAVHHGDN
jgi:FkbM family methyltransferase